MGKLLAEARQFIERKECFGRHPDGLDVECLLCNAEGDCEDATTVARANLQLEESEGFVCTNCGGTELEEFCAIAAAHTPLTVDAQGNVMWGQTSFRPESPVVMRCVSCRSIVRDEDGKPISIGDSTALLEWLSNNKVRLRNERNRPDNGQHKKESDRRIPK